jgi:hypothetical protein
MTTLRDSTSALSNDRTHLTGNYARSFEGEPSSNTAAAAAAAAAMLLLLLLLHCCRAKFRTG